MATDLATGAIPAYYREVYQLCCGSGNEVSSEILTKLLVKSGLPSQTLGSICSEVDTKQGSVSRTKVYKILALVAFAQQGKQPSFKLLDNFSGEEFPVPDLGSLEEFSGKKTSSPVNLGMTYADLCLIDNIEVDLVPEKKGLFLKHVEYQVSSRRLGTLVRRRYNDFVLLRDALLARFPYRLVPKLPPKKIAIGDAHFLEERRRGLRRWLTLVARHPTVHSDPLAELFLRHAGGGADLQHRLRHWCSRVPDEFATSELAARARDLAPPGVCQAEFARRRDEIRQCRVTVLHLRHVAENLTQRSQRYAADMSELSTQLETASGPRGRAGEAGSGKWGSIKQSFHDVAVQLGMLSGRAGLHSDRLQTELGDQIQLLLDVLQAHADLWERHERGVAQEHARALAALMALKKRQMHGATRGNDAESVSDLEACMMRQEGVMADVELRDAFSLHCLHVETQLVHAHLELLAAVLATLARGQARSHAELAEVWTIIGTKCLPDVHSNGS